MAVLGIYCVAMPSLGRAARSSKRSGSNVTASSLTPRHAIEPPRQFSNARDLAQFPGEDAPGIGMRRRMPAPTENVIQSAPVLPQRTTEECYQAFPVQVRSSCPLAVSSPSTSAREHARQVNAWLATGQQRRPPVAIRPPRKVTTQVEESQQEYNRRVVASRRGE